MTTSASASTVDSPADPLPRAIRRIVLLGFMGAGKTTVGRLLAQSLGWTFLDLDDHLERRTGETVPEIFARHGEPHFRRLESSALANALGSQSVVLALGGGSPEQLTNRLLLEQTPGTYLIHLTAPFPVLFDRCMLQSFVSPSHQRPMLSTAIKAEELFHRRFSVYMRLAQHTIDCEHLEAAAAAQATLEHLHALTQIAVLSH